MRITFMGSPDFAVPTLQALADAGHEILCVYAQPPHPAGRGHKEQPCPVHSEAQRRGLAVRTPENMKDEDAVSAFAGLNADIAVVVAYGQILPLDILSAPKHGCINVHASILPRWRGAAPVQRAIQAGDSESGVSIMQMEAGLDTGPVLLERSIPLDSNTTGGSLHNKLAVLGAEACVQVLKKIEAGTAEPALQAADGITYAHKLTTSESRVRWTDDAAFIERTVRAFDPWPRTWFMHEGERIKLLTARIDENAQPHSVKPGTILDGRPAIACGSGVLVLDRLQRAGRKAQDAAEFLRGYNLEVGTCLASE